MDRPTGHVIKALRREGGQQILTLSGKGRDDPYLLVTVLAHVVYDGGCLGRRDVLLAGDVFLNVIVRKRARRVATALHAELTVVVLAVVEADDLLVAAIVLMQEYLVAHRVAGEKGLVCRVLYEVVLVGYVVGTPQCGIVRPIDHHDRRELGGVSHQGEVLPPDYGHERAGTVTLARLIDDHHVEAWHGLP